MHKSGTMQTWYYSSKGERQGPISFDELKARARRGGLDPVTDLVWTEGMQDWKPSGQVAGLFPDDAPSPAGDFNPYAAPGTAPHDLLAPLPIGALQEVPPGSPVLKTMDVVSRAIELTKRHFLKLLGIGIVYIVISAVAEAAITYVDVALGGTPMGQLFVGIGSISVAPQHSIPAALVSSAFSTFIGLGLARVALNFASGEDSSITTLFGQGAKLLRTMVAWFLFGLMVAVGLVLLIVPGIYLALRFGMFQYAIVDRNLGIMESFKYSSDLTKNNLMNLLGLVFMIILIVIAGALALGVGLIFAIPVVTLMFPLAYRFLQFGPHALLDHPGTKVPQIRGQVPML